ncbi:hypothetical protein C7954_1511, partial [Halanaerobium congolense]
TKAEKKDMIEEIQAEVDHRWEKLLVKCGEK